MSYNPPECSDDFEQIQNMSDMSRLMQDTTKAFTELLSLSLSAALSSIETLSMPHTNENTDNNTPEED